MKILKLTDGTFQLDLRHRDYDVIRQSILCGRKRWNLPTRKEAEAKAKELDGLLKEYGVKKLIGYNSILGDNRLPAISLELEKYGKSLTDAGLFYLDHLRNQQTVDTSPLISELLPKWIEAKTNNRLKPMRERGLATIKSMANIFTTDLGNRRIQTITQLDVEKWLNDKKDLGNRSKEHYRNYFGQFINWCIKHGYTKFNPCANIEIHVEEKPTEFFTVDQITELLNLVNTPRWNKLLPYTVICLFAGVRPNECNQLHWGHFEGGGNELVIPAKISKTKRERRIVLADNLKAWLHYYKTTNPGAPLIPEANLPDLVRDHKLKLSFPWIQDGLRHSFATYFISKEKNYSLLETFMGNSKYVLMKHYVRTVTEEEWKKFWAIMP